MFNHDFLHCATTYADISHDFDHDFLHGGTPLLGYFVLVLFAFVCSV